MSTAKIKVVAALVIALTGFAAAGIAHAGQTGGDNVNSSVPAGRSMAVPVAKPVPDDAAAHSDTAYSLLRKRQFKKAIGHFRRSLELRPESAQTHRGLGMAHAALRQSNEAIIHFHRTIELSPQWAEPHVNLGVELSRKGQFPEAITHYRRALSLREDFPEAHFFLGYALVAGNEIEEARRHYDAALSAKPNYAAARVGLGQLLLRQQKAEEAQAQLKRAVEIAPHLPMAHYYLARALGHQGKLEAALHHFKQAVTLKTNWAHAHDALATTYQRLGRGWEAVHHYREALGLDERLIATAYRLAQLFAMHPDDELRDGPEAVQLATGVCEAQQYRNPHAIATLAAAYAECGQFDVAVTTIQKAITIAKKHGAPQMLVEFENTLHRYRGGQPSRLPAVRRPPVRPDRAQEAKATKHLDIIYHVPPDRWIPASPRLGTVILPRVGKTPAGLQPATARDEFVGPAACAECHRDRYETFRQTTHFLTSREANDQTIEGSFDPGRDRLSTKQKGMHYQMQDGPEGYFQAVYVDGEQVHHERMDIVTGSGKFGQTYLYWKDDALFELPVSYFTPTDSWMDSPGYPDGIAVFSRPVFSRCLECHTTYFVAKDETPLNYRYEKTGYVLGVTCERCHGPGREHVDYHRRHPDLDEAGHIVHPGDLPRDRTNDVCGQCHSGDGKALQPSFTYRPGKILADYIDLKKTADAKPGIHSNDQLQRLKLSRCYQSSPTMSCTTCHDPHKKERGNTALFSRRCRTCHKIEDCGADLSPDMGEACVKCHMARQDVHGGLFRTLKGTAQLTMWDHFIRAKIPKE